MNNILLFNLNLINSKIICFIKDIKNLICKFSLLNKVITYFISLSKIFFNFNLKILKEKFILII